MRDGNICQLASAFRIVVRAAVLSVVGERAGGSWNPKVWGSIPGARFGKSRRGVGSRRSDICNCPRN